MDLTILILAYIAIGLSTGFLSGLFGIGGGSIRIPLLAMTGMPLINAFATNMFAIPFSSGTGAYVQRKNIEWKISKYFIPGGVTGIVIATFLVGFVSSAFLAITFFLAALLTIPGLYLNQLSTKIYNKVMPTPAKYFSGAFLSNLIIGMRGGSGGTLFPPILRAMHVEMHHAIATSLYTSMITSFAALTLYIFRGDIIWITALIIGITDVAGAYYGSKVSLKTKSKWLKAGLATIVFLLACSVVYREFF